MPFSSASAVSRSEDKPIVASTDLDVVSRTEDEPPCYMTPYRDGAHCDAAACRNEGGYCRLDPAGLCIMTHMRGRDGACQACACGGGVNFSGSTTLCTRAANIKNTEQTKRFEYLNKSLKLWSVPIKWCTDPCHGCGFSPGSNDKTPGRFMF